MQGAPIQTPVEAALTAAMTELEIARTRGSKQDLAFALRRVGGLSACRLQVESALASLQEARSISAEVHDRYGLAAADDVLALLLCHLGRPGDAAALHLAAAEEFRSLGEPDDEAIARAWAWWALLEADRPTEALDQARLAAELDPTPANLIGPAAPLADLGRLHEAERCLETLSDDPDLVTGWEARILGHVEARRGDAWTADYMFTWALDLLEAEGDLAEVRCCLNHMRGLGLKLPHR